MSRTAKTVLESPIPLPVYSVLSKWVESSPSKKSCCAESVPKATNPTNSMTNFLPILYLCPKYLSKIDKIFYFCSEL